MNHSAEKLQNTSTKRIKIKLENEKSINQTAKNPNHNREVNQIRLKLTLIYDSKVHSQTQPKRFPEIKKCRGRERKMGEKIPNHRLTKKIQFKNTF
jgi:hypothetical protein